MHRFVAGGFRPNNSNQQLAATCNNQHATASTQQTTTNDNLQRTATNYNKLQKPATTYNKQQPSWLLFVVSRFFVIVRYYCSLFVLRCLSYVVCRVLFLLFCFFFLVG